MYKKNYHIHFVGVGGIGMSAIAKILLSMGYTVSGSDLQAYDITEKLKHSGAKIFKGHSAEHLSGADLLVISSAVKQDNPEVRAAIEAGIPIIKRAEMLAEIMRFKYGIAVAGTHGKTSTTAMIAAVLEHAQLDPTVIIGGKLMETGTNARFGNGKFLVAEADESDGSLLKLCPAIAVVTNIEIDHVDFYENFDQIKDTFQDFIERVPFYGRAVLCFDDSGVRDILPKIKKQYITYGMTSNAELWAEDICIDKLASCYKVLYKNKFLGEIFLSLPGIHNIYNSLAAIAVGLEIGIPFERIREALGSLKGVHRRLEIKGEKNGITVIDDYGHHPTEIKATLTAIREYWQKKRLVVIFQPHRYSRTAGLFEEFVKAFDLADILMILPVYSAGEKPIEGVDSFKLYERIEARGCQKVFFQENREDALSFLNKNLQAGDILLTIGAGDVWKLGEEFLKGEYDKQR